MTDEEINEAIAVVRGFVKSHEFNVGKEGPLFTFWIYPEDWNGPSEQPLCPNFCGDLNAMHEVEKFMDEDQWSDYVEYIGGKWEQAMHAPARQRAEAFLRTIGKWKEVTR